MNQQLFLRPYKNNFKFCIFFVWAICISRSVTWYSVAYPQTSAKYDTLRKAVLIFIIPVVVRNTCSRNWKIIIQLKYILSLPKKSHKIIREYLLNIFWHIDWFIIISWWKLIRYIISSPIATSKGYKCVFFFIQIQHNSISLHASDKILQTSSSCYNDINSIH